MPLKIIGAGYPRTGTTSLQLALEQLGFGPCCHMWELLKPEHAWRWSLWSRFFEGEEVNWESVFRGFVATVDAPGSFFWRTLARAYPEAKVILTVRDPESWLQSMQAMTEAAQGLRRNKDISPIVPTVLARMEPAIARERGSGPDPAPGPERDRFLKQQLLLNTEAAKREIAPERLLVFDVKEGWAPLCSFLGVPVPPVPFPHANDGADFLKRLVEGPAQAAPHA